LQVLCLITAKSKNKIKAALAKKENQTNTFCFDGKHAAKMILKIDTMSP